MEDFFKKKFSRKEFLKDGCFFCLGGSAAYSLLDLFLPENGWAKNSDSLFRYEAKFYQKLDEKTVQCQLCFRKCTLANGARSFCRAREPRDGKLYSLFYENMRGAARRAKFRGLKNICHSNGSLNSQAVEELSLYLDAANIALKAF